MASKTEIDNGGNNESFGVESRNVIVTEAATKVLSTFIPMAHYIIHYMHVVQCSSLCNIDESNIHLVRKTGTFRY